MAIYTNAPKDKFTIRVPKSVPCGGWKPVSVPIEAYEQLKNLQEKTGIAPGKLISMMMEFSLERLEIVED